MTVENPMTVTPLTSRLLKAEFAGSVANTNEARAGENYTVTNLDSSADEVTVIRVLGDLDADELSFVNLFISRPVLGDEYQISASGLLLAANGFTVDTSVGKFTASETKIDSMISNMSKLYDTSVESNLLHLLVAVGLSDEEIGGESIVLLPATGLIQTVEGTYGTATYGTATYGG